MPLVCVRHQQGQITQPVQGDVTASPATQQFPVEYKVSLLSTYNN